MDEQFSIPSPEEHDRRFAGGALKKVANYLRKNKRRAGAAVVAGATIAAGTTAGLELNSNKAVGSGPEKVTFFRGAAAYEPGTEVQKSPDNHTVIYTVQPGEYLLVQRPEVVYAGENSAGPNRYVKVNLNNTTGYINESLPGKNKILQSYAFTGENPGLDTKLSWHQTVTLNEPGGLQASEVNKAEILQGKDALDQAVQKDGLQPDNTYPQ